MSENYKLLRRLIITRTIAKQSNCAVKAEEDAALQSVDQAQKFFGGFRIDLSAYATEEALSGI